MANKVRIDWISVEADYITGSMTYAELGRKHEVSEKGIANKARKQKWVKKRAEYRSSLTSTIVGNKLDKVVLDKAAFDNLTDNACDAVLARLTAAVVNPTTDDIPYDPREVALAIKTIQEIKYRRLDIPAPLQRVKDETIPAPAAITSDELQEMMLAGEWGIAPIDPASIPGNGGDKTN